MRHFFIFLSICWFSLALQAQITLTKADMPVAGDSLYISIPDSLFEVDLSQTGPNSTWDFSTLEAILQQRDIFVAPSQVPFAIRIFFSGATHVRLISTPDSIAGFGLGEGFEFFNSTNIGYEAMGFGGTLNGIPLPLANDPVDLVYEFPLTYGADTLVSSSQAELDAFGLGYIRQEQSRETVVDGWGIITTPYGSFDALRVVSTITGRDSISFDTISVAIDRPITKEYKWLSNGEGIPLLQVNTTIIDSIGEIQTSLSYRDSSRADVPLVSISDPIATKPLTLYPNPAKDQVSLSGMPQTGPQVLVNIYSLNGKLVHSIDLQNGNLKLDISHLVSGTYVVRATTKEVEYLGKLMVRE